MRQPGGVNWQPISFNEKTHMFYICSSVSWVGFVSGPTKFVRPGVTYNGSLGAAGVAWPEGSGTLTAIVGNLELLRKLHGSDASVVGKSDFNCLKFRAVFTSVLG